MRVLYGLPILLVSLLSGCATASVFHQAVKGRVVYDRIDPIQAAYKTSDGDLVLCTTATLPERPGHHRYTVCVSRQHMQRPMTNTWCRGKWIELPRTVIEPGWPASDGLAAIPIRAADFDTAVDAEVDACRDKLRVADGGTETIYNITGYGTAKYWEFVYVQQPQVTVASHYRAFTIQPGTTHPHLGKLAYLPVSLVMDGLFAVGSLGGGMPPGPEVYDKHAAWGQP